MSVVSQRITHRQKLANLNAKLLNNYLDKARANGLAVKMKHSSKRSLSNDFEMRPTTGTEKSRSCETSQQSAPEQSVYGSIVSDDQLPLRCQPIASSTPVKESPLIANARPTSQAAHVHTSNVAFTQSQNSQNHETLVSVKVQWPSQTSERILPDDL